MALHQLKTLPVTLDAIMTSSEATALTDLPAGTANGGFAVDDDGRIIVWTRANGGGRTVRLIRDVPAAHELLAVIRKRLAVAAPAEPATTGAPLTGREVEVLHMMANGLKTRPIALRLHVSPATVRNHVQNILRKLDAHSRLEAVAHARRCRLI
jgi:DNA-binding CsgD family transcriptional regulator